MPSCNFYGRRAELGEIDRLLARPNFFFCSISGRRRIGKTSLIQEALKRRGTQSRAMYIQIPDSDERGVIQVFEDAIEDTFFDLDFARKACTNFSDICLLLYVLWKRKFIAAIDEFQYFHRSSLAPFLSHLQSNIDHARSSDVGGGLFALGSIHPEMTAVLEDKNSPLVRRATSPSNMPNVRLFRSGNHPASRARETRGEMSHSRRRSWEIGKGAPADGQTLPAELFLRAAARGSGVLEHGKNEFVAATFANCNRGWAADGRAAIGSVGVDLESDSGVIGAQSGVRPRRHVLELRR